MRFFVVDPNRLPVCFDCQRLTVSELAVIIFIWMLCLVSIVVTLNLKGMS